jgi:pyruvate formate lyase activating enzyme
MAATGTVFDIQRFSIHDGPGIRTTVFFQGCPLRCFWCHNPESWSASPQVQVIADKCIGCGRCVRVCRHDARGLADGRATLRRDRCTVCGACVDSCFAGAVVMTGKTVAVEEVMGIVELDRVFYEHSGGGVTCSGGEPMLQIEFLAALLGACKKRGLHTAVDTSGEVPWDHFEGVLPYTDLFLYDVKAMDPRRHQEATGRDNRRVLENLQALAQRRCRIIVRVPVIPGVNATIAEMTSIAGFIRGLPQVEKIELLTYHRLGEGKFGGLGMACRSNDLRPCTAQQMRELGAVFEGQGLQVSMS